MNNAGRGAVTNDGHLIERSGDIGSMGARSLASPDMMQKTHPDFQDMIKEIEMIEDLRQGTRRLRDKHDIYLPRFEKEGQIGYQRRVARSFLYNIYERAEDSFIGIATRKEAQIENFTGSEEAFFENMDGEGSGLTNFIAQSLKKCFDGHGAIWVDFPKGEIASRQPVFHLISASSIIDWKFSEDSASRLSYIKMVFKKRTSTGADSSQEIRKYIELFPGYYKITEVISGGETKLLDEGEIVNSQGSIIDFVPVILFFGKRLSGGELYSKPPMIDLAYLNIEMFQIDSDFKNSLSLSNLPSRVYTGLSKEQAEEMGTIEISIGHAEALPSGADVKYLEWKGTSLQLTREVIDDTVERMLEMALAMLKKRSGTQKTATEAMIDTNSDSGSIARMVEEVETAINKAVRMSSVFTGIQTQGKVTLNRDFYSSVATPQELQAMLQYWVTGAISRQTLYRWMDRNEVVKDLEVEREKALIEQDDLMESLEDTNG